MPDQENNAVPPPPAVPAPDLPAFTDCAAAVATGNETGVQEVPAVVPRLATVCPELADILLTTPIMLRVDSYLRHNEEAI